MKKLALTGILALAGCAGSEPYTPQQPSQPIFDDAGNFISRGRYVEADTPFERIAGDISGTPRKKPSITDPLGHLNDPYAVLRGERPPLSPTHDFVTITVEGEYDFGRASNYGAWLGALRKQGIMPHENGVLPAQGVGIAGTVSADAIVDDSELANYLSNHTPVDIVPTNRTGFTFRGTYAVEKSQAEAFTKLRDQNAARLFYALEQDNLKQVLKKQMDSLEEKLR